MEQRHIRSVCELEEYCKQGKIIEDWYRPLVSGNIEQGGEENKTEEGTNSKFQEVPDENGKT